MVNSKLDKYIKYAELEKQLQPLLKLQQRIQLFKVSWDNFYECLNQITKITYDNDKPLADPYLSKQVELLLRSCFATISETRDIIEKFFYKKKNTRACGNEGCKKQIARTEMILKKEKYITFEPEHQKILKSSICNEHQIDQWSMGMIQFFRYPLRQKLTLSLKLR